MRRQRRAVPFVNVPGRDWAEIVATTLLAVTAVATAWSGYQANRWNGEQAKAQAAANRARIESTRASDVANRQIQIDVAVFMEWVNATAEGDRRRASFYRDRFRDEFRPAFDAWIAMRPLRNPSAERTPFTLPEYRLAANKEADLLEAQASEAAEEARANIQHSSNYVLAVVLFTTALFFAGMSLRLSDRRLRLVLLGLGCLVFVGTLTWVATSPITVSV